jgi:hypothetical protein
VGNRRENLERSEAEELQTPQSAQLLADRARLDVDLGEIGQWTGQIIGDHRESGDLLIGQAELAHGLGEAQTDEHGQPLHILHAQCPGYAADLREEGIGLDALEESARKLLALVRIECSNPPRENGDDRVGSIGTSAAGHVSQCTGQATGVRDGDDVTPTQADAG